MAARGPIPRPTTLKLLDGTARRDRMRNEPIPRSISLECPVANASPAVKQIWAATVAELQAMKIAYASDADTLMCYCEAVASHRRASALLAKSDVLIKGLSGQPVHNPALGVQQRAAAIIRAFAQEFGLTPSARTRIEVTASDDGADDIFAGAG